jgi:serine/threonine protein kinase
MEYLHN